MTRQSILGLTTMTLVLAAGSPIAFAQSGRGNDRDQNNTTRQPADTRQPRDDARRSMNDANARKDGVWLCKASKLIGSDLNNPNGEDIGEIEDLIVERGSGRVVFAVVSAGGVLGMGGKDFAIPLRDLTWSDADKAYQANMTPEQVERQTEFLPENWNDLQTTTWMDSFRDWIGVEEEDTWASSFENTEATRLEGKVVDVRRESRMLGTEVIYVTVEPKDGRTREVVMGPSWYVMSHDSAPYRGSTIVINGVERDDGVFVASSAGQRGSELTLRGEDGAPAWASQPSSGDAYPSRYVLMSDLIGANGETRGTNNGTIDDVIIERGSGQVAFVAFDPNENFLGIGDELKLVPWSMVMVDRDMNVNIDADQATITNAMNVPDDLDRLDGRKTVDGAYRAFGAEPTHFRPMSDARRPVNGRDGMKHDEANRTGDAWGKDSRLVTDLAKGEKVSINGTVTAISNESISRGTPEATVITVNTTDRGQVKVMLAPKSHMDQQKMALRVGDTVRIEGRKAIVDGREVHAAWSIKSGDRSLTLWDQSRPTWAQ